MRSAASPGDGVLSANGRSFSDGYRVFAPATVQQIVGFISEIENRLFEGVTKRKLSVTVPSRG